MTENESDMILLVSVGLTFGILACVVVLIRVCRVMACYVGYCNNLLIF